MLVVNMKRVTTSVLKMAVMETLGLMEEQINLVAEV